MSAQTTERETAQPPVRQASGLSLALAQGGIEFKQFVRTRESLVFTLLFPVMLMLIFGSIFANVVITPPGEIPAVTLSQYFVTGMIASGIMATGFQNLAITIPIERDRGVLKRYRGTPMPKWVYFAGKILCVAALAFIAVVLLLGVAVAFYDINLPDTGQKWFTFGWVSVLGLVACTLCGIAFSGVAKSGRAGPAVVTPIALILQFTSGVFFQYNALPHWMQQFAALFPLKWMCQGLRSVFLPESFAAQEVTGSYELGRVALVLAAWCVGGLILCLVGFRWTTKREG
ncbi:ABC transporter permease [Catellatospora chokoriensis]|uniref:Transport permease protein n=1 Tax=Catellatospora chokoriensis TaxID=310353 RepID=A0A8J3JUX2_9ACTN|nr:ABC transporter permease [Catellatospora chokoriensis]GIF87278.1 transport permease protein [Catellatospora chokoriensis]